MRIVIAGGSGFIGEALVRRLLERGDDVAVLTRNAAHVDAGRALQWDARTQGPWSVEVANADAVINLAGENIGGGRWTEERKRRLIDSRLNATSAIAEALRAAPPRERTLINASAVGFYGDRGDEELDESSPRGNGFLAELTERWESAARAAEPFARVVLLRLGLVLASDGGVLPKMLLPFRFGVGGRVGNGRQWMSWVSLDDVIRMFEWALDEERVRGVYNVTAPQPVRNRDFARAVGHAMHRPAIVPAPRLALRLVLGEMANDLLLAGQRVMPMRATHDGFAFRDSRFDDVVTALLQKRR